MDPYTAKASIQPTIDALNAAWNRWDGAAFADKCTTDVDFINLLGMYVKGRTAVTETHERIFHGPYAGSALEFSIEHVRVLSPNLVLAIVLGTLQIPSGPVQGVVKTIATMLFVRADSEWRVASFQNTKREATAPNHSAIMLDAVERGGPTHGHRQIVASADVTSRTKPSRPFGSRGAGSLLQRPAIAKRIPPDTLRIRGTTRAQPVLGKHR
jgi:uncharacterized protein (TIGR02246 family)